MRMSVRFNLGNLLLTHTEENEVIVSAHKLPDASQWRHSDILPTTLIHNPVIAHSITLPNASDVRVSHLLGTRQNSEPSFLAFDPTNKLHCARLCMRSSGILTNTATQCIRLPHMTSTEAISAGAHRAVWLERNWDIDQVRLVRFWWARVRIGVVESLIPKTGVLLPASPNLPLRPADIRALAFDETTGRLCLGLYSGKVYVLDYGST
jgi:hypothetical protein